MPNQRISNGEYYGRAVTWTLVGFAALIGIVLMVYFGTGTMR